MNEMCLKLMSQLYTCHNTWNREWDRESGTEDLIPEEGLVCPNSRHGLAILFLPLLFSAFVLKSGHANSRGERVEADQGVVATDETECSKIGKNVLYRGGHAVDAAVAATLCIGVVSPADSGLGGGGFILVRPAKGDAKVFDMRETAPGRASKDMFSKMNETEWKVGPLSIAIPGQLAGLYTIHQQYGKLSWESLVKPAENLARTGFKISQSLFQKMASAESIIMADEELRNILKALSKSNVKDVSSPLLVHRTVEALKYALALRMNLGDPGFVNITKTLNSMISDATAEYVKNHIDDKKTFDPPHYGSKWSQVNDHGTSHICIVDRHRNVVTMTTSINTRWGSKVMSESTGIFLNNQMYDFSIPTSKVRPGAPANFISPFKRPLSSMAPIVLLKGGQVRAVIGSAGGLLIPDAVTQVLVNFFVRKKHVFTAVKAPRFYHRLYPNVLLYENYSSHSGDRYGYCDQTLTELRKKGHNLKQATSGMTTCQFVVQVLEGKKSGQLIAVSDPRKGGFPAGY
ncbi:hypothetical protein DH2020_043254 [Rehmannia glutinosa]|uniref:Gamma-glutamyltranspeptidase n=1 Tax=Rehmannia glutinosa TaxID=99300 RepID=A0ABR0UKX6_REHGL